MNVSIHELLAMISATLNIKTNLPYDPTLNIKTNLLYNPTHLIEANIIVLDIHVVPHVVSPATRMSFSYWEIL